MCVQIVADALRLYDLQLFVNSRYCHRKIHIVFEYAIVV